MRSLKRALQLLSGLFSYFISVTGGNLFGQVQPASPEWQNPEIFNVNKEAPHATLMPYGDELSALTKKRAESVFYNRKGQPVEYLSSKVGFRKVEIIDNVFLINGVPVLIKGVNRHNFHITVKNLYQQNVSGP